MQVSPPGHLPSVWEPYVGGEPGVDIAAIAPGAFPATLLVIGAHPDDETIGAGRLISMWRRFRGPVTAVLATDGEACVDHVLPRPDGIAGRRREEWRAALGRLGVAETSALGLPDGGLEQYQDTLAAALRARLEALGRRAVLAAPARTDPHPDHRAVGRATATVAAERGVDLLEYPVWLTFWGDPNDLGRRRIIRLQTDRTAEDEREQSLECYASQLRPLADGLAPVVPAAMLDHHREQRLVTEVDDR